MSTKQLQGKWGGFSDKVFFDNDTATDRARACCVLFRDEVAFAVNDGKPFAGFVPIYYQTQVVAGINYKILVMVSDQVGARGHVMMEVFWPPGPKAMPELTCAKRE
ncbi:PREDICTED: uncharacterized protein LOC109461866 [Branchiostoma belcheri]|uniref:Uncharacterized protein LOC109461866 n=1 Tax=Branchiostoma belcheri TaxID=7741 RepID=A0A6P4XT74_BRABE|nr:PREDICTED: uncharacterized protein LOC109461866 [Branchiostoma belcheri]